jgi:hypothetical protein
MWTSQATDVDRRDRQAAADADRAQVMGEFRNDDRVVLDGKVTALEVVPGYPRFFGPDSAPAPLAGDDPGLVAAVPDGRQAK